MKDDFNVDNDSPLPIFQFRIKTAWYIGLVFCLVLGFIWYIYYIDTLQMYNWITNIPPSIASMYVSLRDNAITEQNLLFSCFIIPTLILSILRCYVKITFSTNPSRTELIYQSYWCGILVKKERIPVYLIDCFRILARSGGIYGMYNTVALTFINQKIKYLTSYRNRFDAPSLTEQLNQYLVKNDVIEPNRIQVPMSPLTTDKENKRQKWYPLVMIIALILLIINFVF
jgi:hypothetical protein